MKSLWNQAMCMVTKGEKTTVKGNMRFFIENQLQRQILYIYLT